MVEYIDRLVRSLEVRKELENHFEDALSRVERELERTRKAEQLVAEFGDEAVLAVLIRRGKRRCRKEGTMNISGVIGLGLLVLLIVPPVAIVGDVGIFVNVPSLIICLGWTAALGIISFGIGDLVRGLWVLRVLVVRVPPETVSSREVSVLRGLIGPVYASGLIGAVIGLINMLAKLEDPSMVGMGMAICVLCPFYAVLMAEVVLRPAVRLIEHGKLPGGATPEVSSEPKTEREPELA